jgi:hypothetical protein
MSVILALIQFWGCSFEDFDCADIRAIPDTWIHRSTDIEVTKADERGVLRGYTVMPPLICPFFLFLDDYHNSSQAVSV